METPEGEQIASARGIRVGIPGAEGFQFKQLLTASTAHLTHDFFTSFVAPLLIIFSASMGLSKWEAGLLMVFVQGPSVLQPVIGNVADRVNLRSLVILGPAMTGVLMSIVGLAPNYATLAVMLTLAGVSSALFHSVGPAFAGTLSGRRIGRGMGIWMVGGELGYSVGPVAIAALVQFHGTKAMPWLGLIGIGWSIVLYVRLRKVTASSIGLGRGLPWRDALKRMRPILIAVIGITTMRAFLAAGLSTFLPLYLNEKGASLWLAGASLTVLQAAGIVGALFGGTLSDRLGRRRTLGINLFLTALCMVPFLAFGGWVQALMIPFIGLLTLSVPTLFVALMQESFPDNRALANGMFGAMQFVILAIAGVVVGAIAEVTSLAWTFGAGAALTLLTVPLIFILPQESRAGDGATVAPA